SPIPQGTTAYLILSSGTTAGQYGLIVNTGGNFLVYGAAKTPSTTVPGTVQLGPGGFPGNFNVIDATGWQLGDTITIDSEAVVLTGLSGNQITGFSGTLGQAHFSTNTVRINDLTHNVLIRSSGTSTSANTAYLY